MCRSKRWWPRGGVEPAWIASETRTDTLNAVRTVAGTQRANEEPLESNPEDPA